MSLVITTYVPEGIVLAGDSRLTLSWTQPDINNPNKEYSYSITASDNNNKVFQIKNKFGLATFGAADIKGIPISGYINQFIEEKLTDETEIDEIPDFLHDFFGNNLGKPLTQFYVTGYKVENKVSVPYIYFISIGDEKTERVNFQSNNIIYNSNWGGEIEVMSRLLSNIKLEQNGNWIDLNAPGVPFNFFTLQDAIDFCLYAVRTTIETFRFQQRIKTVGGPVDILTITPNGVKWINRKEYTVANQVGRR